MKRGDDTRVVVVPMAEAGVRGEGDWKRFFGKSGGVAGVSVEGGAGDDDGDGRMSERLGTGKTPTLTPLPSPGPGMGQGPPSPSVDGSTVALVNR